jgi:16S rRNA (uracil1498-N3)-methyltransferase
VTPPLFLLPELAAGLAPGARVELTGPEARHAATVKRLGVGETVLLADGRGLLAQARAISVERDRVGFEIDWVRAEPEPDPRLVVIQALPKGDRAELAVEVLTELGVAEIVPWSAERSVSQWRGADKIDRGMAKWQRTALEASKQSRRSRVPVVAPLADTAGVAVRLAASAAAFVLHEDAADPLAAQPVPSSGEVVLVVGPEGGISADELARFAEAGARPVRLGPEVLRTSTAGAAALAVLGVSSGRWR